MRIAVVTWRFPERTEPFVVEHVVGLVRRGIECVVFANDLAPEADAPELQPVRDRVEIHSTKDMARLFRHAARPSADRPDVVHFMHAAVAFAHRALLPRLRVPTVVTCRGSTVRVDSLRSQWMRDGLAEVFGVVDRVHCVSSELADRVLQLGARPEQLHVASTGVNLGVFSPQPGSARPPGLALRVVSVGRLNWVKGYEYAVQAVRLARDEGHRIAYTIVGADDGADAAVRLAIRDYGIEDVVTLMGHLPPGEVRGVLAGSDVFLLSSVSEGASRATMEAMAMGLPVVVTDVGGMREFVEDGVHGRVVPSRDPVALAAAIAELSQPEVRREMGERASRDARDRFDAAAQLERLVDLYAELVSARPRPARSGSERTGPAVRERNHDHPSANVDDDDLVSVVVVAYNASRTIEQQLRALSFQAYEGPWEVVVVDNCSTDDTYRRTLAWADGLANLRVVSASDRRNIYVARNVGVRAAWGSRIVMCDADDVVAPGWLAALARALERSPLVVGPLERSTLMPGTLGISDQVDTEPSTLGGRIKFLTSNCGMRREVFEIVGGFDESLQRGGDVEFGWRAMDRGFSPVFVPEAVVHFRSKGRASDAVRQGFSDGRSKPALFMRHGNAAMHRPSRREVVAGYRALARGLPAAIKSNEARLPWIYDVAQSAGQLVGSLQNGVSFL